jgi:hypothetical protein
MSQLATIQNLARFLPILHDVVRRDDAGSTETPKLIKG